MPAEALSIRTAHAGDVAAICALTREAYAKWVPRIGREPRPMTADYGTAVAAHRIDLAMIDDALVGLVEMIETSSSFVIENIAVVPRCQGHGLGSHMLGHAELTAAGLGHRRVCLYTNALFVENLRFYDRRGYRLDREEAWVGGTIAHLSKRIHADAGAEVAAVRPDRRAARQTRTIGE